MIDLNITCYSYEHLFWSFALGIPMIAVWVIGAPLLGLLMLIKKRHNLDDIEVKRYWIVTYQGLTDKAFYWEFVNVFRKILLLSFNVFLPQGEKIYKGMLAIMLVIALYRILIKLKPYTLKVNNELEMISSVATGFTLSGGLVFSSEQTIALLDLFIFLII